MDQELRQELVDIFGPEGVSDAVVDLVTYSYDASDHRQRPWVAVWPTETAQVAELMRLAWRRELPVTPRGAGTGMAGGAVPARGGVVLDLCRMCRILELRLDDRQVVLQPGVVYQDLQKTLAPHGFFFPPDPASGKVCTIGGNVATNAGGIRGAKYGVTRDYVLGLEVVLPDGRITRLGGHCIKSSSGLDLVRLMVGSEGVLGVVTEVTLKIAPRPLVFRTCQASFDRLEDAGRAVSAIMHAAVVPSVLEILDQNTIRLLRERRGMDLPPVQAMLLVETDGFTAGEAEFQMQRVVEVFQSCGARSLELADSPREAERLWQGRKAAGSTAAQLRPANVSEDVTVPMSRLPQLLEGVSAIVEERDLPFVIFGHAGDGNLHPKIMYDPFDPRERAAAQEAVEQVFALTCRLGGTLSGEHGIGLAKAPFLHLEHDAAALELMRGIKRLFDPKNILNPGKMDLD